jgi:4-amino-4-deoxy-L-arabinose transferase-like glycosyltransferase
MKIAAVMSAPFIVFVALAVPFLNQPIDTWEWLNLCAGQRIAATGVPSLDCPVAPAREAASESVGRPSLLLMHPPSSAYLIAAAFRLFGNGEWQARLPGVLSVVLTAVLLVILARRLFRDDRQAADRVGVVAVCLYLIHPATMQGALYLSFSEGTLLPLSWLLFVFAWFETLNRPRVVRVSMLGLCLAIALWAKITTSLALPVSIAIVTWGMEGIGAASLLFTGVTGLGLVLFLGSWWGYAAYLAGLVGLRAETLWTEPFRYLIGEGQVVEISVRGFLLNVSRTFIFLGPLLVFMAGTTTVCRVGQYARNHRGQSEDLIPILAAMVLVGYVALPGGTGAFPKYQLVILPLLAWLAARDFASPGLPRLLLVTIFVVGVVYYFYLVGDPLKMVNHDMRIAQFAGGTSSVVSRAGRAALLYVLFPLVASRVVRSWRPAVLTAAAASQMALILLQIHGGYFTKHSYGTPLADFTRTIDLLTSATPAGSEILALPEFGYKSGRRTVPGMKREFWSDPESLEKVIRQEKPSAVIYGLPTHTILQLRGLVSNPQLGATLERAYSRVDVGEFTVWLRGR